MNDYFTAFQKAGLLIGAAKEFPAKEISVDKIHSFADKVDFNYVVFKLHKLERLD